MSTTASHLHLVPSRPAEPDEPSHGEDVGLTTAILVVAASPVVLAAAGIGPWQDASVGLGTVGVIFAGRELLGSLLARARSRRAP